MVCYESVLLLGKIKESYQNSHKTYGSPRICSELRSSCETCSRKRVAGIMKEYDMAAKMKKRFKITTKTNPKEIPAPNLLNQNFIAKELNQRWVADFTYVDTKGGLLYVAAVPLWTYFLGV